MPTPITSPLTQVPPGYLAGHFAPEPASNRARKALGNRGFGTFTFPNRRAAAPVPGELPSDFLAAATPAILVAHPTPLPTVQYILECIKRSLRTRSRFERRLQVLVEEAEAEGYAFNPDSEAAFRWFLNRYPLVEAGRLFLMDNGNLRATWKDGRDTQVGLQFLPGDSVQYVIFTRRSSSRAISRVHGYDTLDGIPRLLAAYDLTHILET